MKLYFGIGLGVADINELGETLNDILLLSSTWKILEQIVFQQTIFI
jgi:hypothetical protein